MKLDRPFAVLAGLTAVLLLWWGATTRTPRASLIRARFSPRVAFDAPAPRPGSVPQDRAEELPPPDPVLTQSAQRRFSSPVSNGAADGGIARAPEETEPQAGSPSSLSAGGVNLPGGSAAPTAHYAYGYSPAAAPSDAIGSSPRGPSVRERPSGEGPGPAPKSAPQEHADDTASTDPGNVSPPEVVAPEERKLAGAAGNLVKATHTLKNRGDAAAMRAGTGAAAGIMRQLDRDRKVDTGIRGAIADLQSSGRPVTMESVTEAAGDVLKENGLTPEDVDMETAIARASAPPEPPIPPEVLTNTVRAIVSTPPLPPEVEAEIQKMADKPPPPRAPAPRGALSAFAQNKDVFDKALKNFGVKPEHILGILGVETTWGRNTGKYPLPATLLAISRKTDKNGRPTKAAIQAGRDLAALARLSAQGNLGGLAPGQVRGSYAGAMGIPQFLPTSWEAYSRSPDGGKRDPFNFGTAAYSVGNYLKVHGYNKDVARSIWGYNHSQEYVDKVLGLSADVKAALNTAAKP